MQINESYHEYLIEEEKDPIEQEYKVFLGGTCNDSTWRDELMPMLDIDYFNPVVDDWDNEAMKEEERQKTICKFHLYVITPNITGFYSIAELVESAMINPETTIFCWLAEYDDKEFNKAQIKSFGAIEDLLDRNGCKNIFNTLDDVADFLNNI